MLDTSLGSIMIASPDHAPAGRYARQALSWLGIWESLEPRILLADNVRLAARYVAFGSVEIGIVYATDADAFGDRLSIVHRFSNRESGDIVYRGAVCAGSADPIAAAAFLAFLASPTAEPIWRRRGFLATEGRNESEAMH